MGNIDDILRPSVTSSSQFNIDNPVPCPKCDCPVQWRPFSGCAWQCYDCELPVNDARCREYRIPILVEGTWEWESNLERRLVVDDAVRIQDSSSDESAGLSLADDGQNPANDSDGKYRCLRCGRLDDFTDTPIHDGRSTRRDCKRCGRFVEFARWCEKA